MNNPESYRHLVDILFDEIKELIHQTLRRATDFDQRTKLRSINFLKTSIAKENEQVCSILFETKEKEYFYVEKMFFPWTL